MQPYRLFQAEEEVHVVDCLAARSLQQVVYHRNDQQLVFLFQQIDQALVRIYHLFQIRVLVGDESERVISDKNPDLKQVVNTNKCLILQSR